MKTCIKQLTLRGFKSFNRKIDVVFQPGLNTIIGPNGSGKSARGDTEVLLSSGELKPIAKLVDDALQQAKNIQKLDDGVYTTENPAQIKVLGLKTNTLEIIEKDVAAFIRREGEPALYEIETASGKKVTTTGCHPVMIFKDNKVKSELVRNLKAGQLIATPRKINFNSIAKINFQGFALDENFARFLGYLIGDGYIRKDRFELVNADKEILNDFKECIKIVFKRAPQYEKQSGAKATRLICWQKDVSHLLFDLFKPKTNIVAITSLFKAIPEEFLISNNDVVSNLLAALFDTDGYVSKSVPEFEFCNKNEKLINQIQLLLLRFGILSIKKSKHKAATNTTAKTKHKYFSLFIYGQENLKLLYKNIPMRCKHKLKRLRTWIQKDVHSNPNVDLLPQEINKSVKDLTKTLAIEYKPKRKDYPRLAAYIENRCNPTRVGIEELLPIFENKLAVLKNSLKELSLEQGALIQILNSVGLSGRATSKFIGLKTNAIRDTWEKGKFRARPKNLEKFYNFLKAELNTRISESMQILDLLKVFARSDIFWDKIINIREVPGEPYVYDLTIPNCHNFIGNGIFVHNSNILDGLCFILGRLSSKDLRAENFADLLYKRKGTVAAEGEISIVLDNSAKIFPVEEKQVEIRRKIKKSGQTQFKINGRNATRTQALDLLAMARIFPDGHNIILQGDIARFVDLKPIERRQLIEEISGIALYEEKKAKALAELAKVDERLKEVSIILREKETYMKNLEDEKRGAETYRDLQENIKKFQAGELQLRLGYAKEKRDKVAANIESKILEISNLKLELEISSKKITTLKQQLGKLEKEIQKKGGEESLQLQKEVEVIRVELAKARTLISTSLNEIERVQKRKSDLEQNSASILIKLKEKEAEKANLEKEISAVQKQEDVFKKGSVADLKSLEADVDKLEKEIDVLKNKKDKTNTEVHELGAKVQIQENELKLIQNRIGQLKNSTKDFAEAKEQQQRLAKEIDALAREDSKLALELGELRKEIIKKEENLTKSRILSRGSQEALLRDAAIKILKDRAISGIYGTVAELGNAKQQYATALSIAAGNRMRNVVVEKVDTAIKCLELLKNSRAGIATFLPLDKLRTFEDDVPDSVLKKDGVLGLAHELIECEARYKKVFKYVFRNTLVVQNIDIARSLGVGKYRMITLDGDLFEPSGAITGGFRHSAGVVFETIAKEQIDKLEVESENLKEQFNALENKRAKLEDQLFEFRKSKAEADAKAELTEKGSIAKEIGSLEKRAGLLEESIKKNSSGMTASEKELAKLEAEIVEKVGDRNAAKTQLHDAQFGDSVAKAEELQKRRGELEAAAAAAKATLENALRPEQENILKVLKELDKEKKSFEKQIAEEEAKVKNLEKDLDAKEKEQESFHGKLKQAFEEQTCLSNSLRETETEYNKFSMHMNNTEQEKNNLAIEKAQHEAELAAIEEEAKPFAGIEPAQFKTLEEAKRKTHEARGKLEALGNVNLRALEIFEDVLKEYNELAVRVTKLKEEQASVLQIIDEVENKKTDTFMKTYSEISSHFSTIYGKTNAKYAGELELENPDKPFEAGVLVKIQDAKKKRVSIAALSGGEKVLVALAFIFAIQEHEPAAFYLLDEIDAALDKLNSENVAKLLKEYSQRAQVIIISHNDSVISEANSLYGISMNKNGESTIVSLKL